MRDISGIKGGISIWIWSLRNGSYHFSCHHCGTEFRFHLLDKSEAEKADTYSPEKKDALRFGNLVLNLKSFPETCPHCGWQPPKGKYNILKRLPQGGREITEHLPSTIDKTIIWILALPDGSYHFSCHHCGTEFRFHLLDKSEAEKADAYPMGKKEELRAGHRILNLASIPEKCPDCGWQPPKGRYHIIKRLPQGGHEIIIQ